MNKVLTLALLLSVHAAGGQAVTSTPGGASLRVARIFSSGMVLQRGKRIVVWGWAAPGTPVRVSLSGGSGAPARTASVRASADGAWEASLAPRAAGGPYRLQVGAASEQRVFDDVLIGDVWLASGQSNMEWPVARDADLGDALARATMHGNAEAIREFRIPSDYSFTPEDSLVAGAWTRADSAHLPAMSAVAYYFARALRDAPTPGRRVPIGIINNSWGGSAIESWLSRPAQGITDAAWVAIRAGLVRQRDSTEQALRRMLGDLPAADAGYAGTAPRWAATALDESAWRPTTVPGYWEAQGYAGLDGVGWYRTTFTLSAAEAQAGVVLALDAIDDDDVTWVNGEQVGRTNGYQVQRRYVIPTRLLTAGTNQLTVRVADGAGGGGINGAVSLTFADGSARSLAGRWAFRVGEVSFATDGQVMNKIPGVAYNRMLHPILRMPLAGVLWYQGESNANNDAQARAYRAQFTTLVTDWRRARSAPALPFLWVQLPNYGAPDREPPATSAWALLRESTEGALSLPRTGQAVIIELGDPNDIHPRRKRDVGGAPGARGGACRVRRGDRDLRSHVSLIPTRR